jgi:hypothetical protein
VSLAATTPCRWQICIVTDLSDMVSTVEWRNSNTAIIVCVQPQHHFLSAYALFIIRLKFTAKFVKISGDELLRRGSWRRQYITVKRCCDMPVSDANCVSTTAVNSLTKFRNVCDIMDVV